MSEPDDGPVRLPAHHGGCGRPEETPEEEVAKWDAAFPYPPAADYTYADPPPPDDDEPASDWPTKADAAGFGSFTWNCVADVMAGSGFACSCPRCIELGWDGNGSLCP